MGLVTPALDLSVTLKLGLRPSFSLNDKLYLFLDLDVGRWDLSLQHHCFWTWMLGDGTCHSSIGLVNLKLGRILNDKLCLFLDLHVGKRDLSLQHRTCLQMAIQTTIFVPIQTLDGYQLAPIQRS